MKGLAPLVLIVTLALVASACMPYIPPPQDPGNDTAPDTGNETDPGDETPASDLTLEVYCSIPGPFCARMWDETVPQLDEMIVIEFHHFPLSIHEYAFNASLAAECARDQDSYRAYVDALFAEDRNLTLPVLVDVAESLGLDAQTLESCVVSTEHADVVDADYARGVEKGVRGTPSSFVTDGENNVQVQGAQPLSVFEDAIARAEAGEWDPVGPSIDAPDSYTVEAGSSTVVPVEYVGELDAWVEEGVFQEGDGTALLANVPTDEPLGNSFDVTLELDGPVSTWGFSFDEPISDDFEVPFSIGDDNFEMVFSNTTMTVMRIESSLSVSDEEPHSDIRFVDERNEVVFDNGITGVLVELENPSGLVDFARFDTNGSDQLFDVIDVEVTGTNESGAFVELSAFGSSVERFVDISDPVEIDLAGQVYTVRVWLTVDQETERVATLEINGEERDVRIGEIFEAGNAWYRVNTIFPSELRDPFVWLYELETAVRFSGSDLEVLRGDGFIESSYVNLTVSGDPISSFGFVENHRTPADEGWVDDTFLIFRLEDDADAGYRAVRNNPGAYVDDGEVWISASDPGNFTLRLEARMDGDLAQASVAVSATLDAPTE